MEQFSWGNTKCELRLIRQAAGSDTVLAASLLASATWAAAARAVKPKTGRARLLVVCCSGQASTASNTNVATLTPLIRDDQGKFWELEPASLTLDHRLRIGAATLVQADPAEWDVFGLAESNIQQAAAVPAIYIRLTGTLGIPVDIYAGMF
ncbi:MAG TPA: hypothetical protein VM238_18395 [Phycisphaerae bacterium]|nr:hypothetical protein [Phycisphaerae bacterium]